MAWKKKAKSGVKSQKRVAYVALDGEKFYKLTEWRKKNPGKIYFESGLERDCYLLLDKAGLDFDFQPPTRELLESFNTMTFSLKTKKLYKAKVRNMSYTSDFLVHCPDGTELYIESKGFFHKDSRIRYKFFQASLKPGEMTLLIKSTLDLRKVIEIINEQFSTPKQVKEKTIKEITL